MTIVLVCLIRTSGGQHRVDVANADAALAHTKRHHQGSLLVESNNWSLGTEPTMRHGYVQDVRGNEQGYSQTGKEIHKWRAWMETASGEAADNVCTWMKAEELRPSERYAVCLSLAALAYSNSGKHQQARQRFEDSVSLMEEMAMLKDSMEESLDRRWKKRFRRKFCQGCIDARTFTKLQMQLILKIMSRFCRITVSRLLIPLRHSRF